MKGDDDDQKVTFSLQEIGWGSASERESERKSFLLSTAAAIEYVSRDRFSGREFHRTPFDVPPHDNEF
jgi:hypothetical protein